MNNTSALAVVVLVAAATYLMRGGIIVGLAGRDLPPAMVRALSYVGPAVLSALAINLAAGGEGGPHLAIAEVAALVVGGGVALWRKSLIEMLAAGMVTLWVLSAVS